MRLLLLLHLFSFQVIASFAADFSREQSPCPSKFRYDHWFLTNWCYFSQYANSPALCMFMSCQREKKESQCTNAVLQWCVYLRYFQNNWTKCRLMYRVCTYFQKNAELPRKTRIPPQGRDLAWFDYISIYIIIVAAPHVNVKACVHNTHFLYAKCELRLMLRWGRQVWRGRWYGWCSHRERVGCEPKTLDGAH